MNVNSNVNVNVVSASVHYLPIIHNTFTTGNCALKKDVASVGDTTISDGGVWP